ncbi:hypothetical protein EMCG_01639 [[Emmonsia] crescens]|uniref:Uncharacterized protein n=1 Tax=[Emmonsia] crescens TaxID=73230 RepID=A0A0G2I1N4_9EURO|nr:hypothetical protein EMCG_01639 [Emmonsia crescens UAMH 3008]
MSEYKLDLNFYALQSMIFGGLFSAVWEKSITSSNIIAAFAAAGLHFFEPSYMLSKFQIHPITPPEVLQPITPTTIEEMRVLMKQVNQHQHQISSDLHRVIQAEENIALDKAVLLIENEYLQKTLNEEGKHCKHGKAMRLLDSSHLFKAQFFSSTKAQRAHEINAVNEAVKESEQICKKDVKLQHTILKKQKKEALTEQRIVREATCQITAQLRDGDRAARTTKQKLDIEDRAAKKVIEQQMRQEKAAARVQA